MNLKNAPICKAVFPVAGMGTRFLPATKASPKEMLTVVNKPLIQYAVEEAYAAGIREMIFVTCHNKNVIEDHFDFSYFFEAELIAQNKNDLLSIVRDVTPDDMECVYIRQHKALGLGHAVLCAETIICNEPFALILADDLMIGKTPIMKQMTEAYERYGNSVIAVQDVPKHLTNQYGIVQAEPISDTLLQVQKLVEKPDPALALSTIAVVGRYILSPQIFDEIRAIPKKDHGEIQLTDAIDSLLKKETVLAYRYEGDRYDCGSLLGYLKANVILGAAHPVEGEEFLKWLQETAFHINSNL